MATNDAIKKLLDISGPATGSKPVRDEIELPLDLGKLQSQRNGFFAFESALEVFPQTSSPISYSLNEWNDYNLWKYSYGELKPNGICIEQDIFGTQFVLVDGVFSFDPETAETEFLAATIKEWAEKLLDEYNYLTGYSLAHDWQVKHGPLSSRTRLVPITPFVLGGVFVFVFLFVLFFVLFLFFC